jgi:hypothetical protein
MTDPNMRQLFRGYPCGCTFITVNGLVVEAKFCTKHKVVWEALGVKLERGASE